MDHNLIDRLTFSRIVTEAELRGKKIISTYSFHKPVNIDEYRRIDRALVRAYGSENSRTIGVPAPFNIVLRGKTGGWPYVFGANN